MSRGIHRRRRSMSRPLAVAAVGALAGASFLVASAANGAAAVNCTTLRAITTTAQATSVLTCTGGRLVYVPPTVAPTPTPTPTPTVTPTSPTPTPTVTPTTPSPTPSSPTPTPTPTGKPSTCVTAPSACGFPDATNTGVQPGVTLTPSGSITASTPGQVIQNVSLTGNSTINVSAPNVTIRNVSISSHSPGNWGITVIKGGQATIDHVTIRGNDPAGGGDWSQSLEYAVLVNGGGPGTIIEHSDLSDCTDCIQGDGTTVTGNYIHNLANPPGAHIDGFQCNSACQVTITGNTILNSWTQTSAIALFADFGTPKDSTISGNLLAGGGYAIYGGGTASTGVSITNNTFSKVFWPAVGYWGVQAYFYIAGNAWSGNVLDGTGAPVTP